MALLRHRFPPLCGWVVCPCRVVVSHDGLRDDLFCLVLSENDEQVSLKPHDAHLLLPGALDRLLRAAIGPSACGIFWLPPLRLPSN